MLKRRWMKKVLEESRKDQIEMPWSRAKRQRNRAVSRRIISA